MTIHTKLLFNVTNHIEMFYILTCRNDVTAKVQSRASDPLFNINTSPTIQLTSIDSNTNTTLHGNVTKIPHDVFL